MSGKAGRRTGKVAGDAGWPLTAIEAPYRMHRAILGVVISFLVVLLTMHTMVLERTREIGILKALGSSRWGILSLLLSETLMMAICGAVFGLAVTYSVEAVLKQTSPSLTILISGSWILKAIALAILGATAGAIVPAFRASGFDPVDALAYE